MSGRFRLEFSTDHGLFVWGLPAVPRIGDHIRIPDQHAPGTDEDLDRAERVALVLWHENGTITVDCRCEAIS